MKHLKISILMLLLFTAITGVGYPFLITGIAAGFFPGKAGGSFIYNNGVLKGSELIGQKFTRPEYFHGRPSAVDYDPSLSGGSNLGPSSRKFIEGVVVRAAIIRKENRLNEKTPLPGDVIFASGSGLDPHISVEAAKIQAERIAAARGIAVEGVIKLIDLNKERQLPFYGKTYVNVVKLNMALDPVEKN